MRRALLQHGLLAFAAAGAIACEEEQIDPAARLRRPSGLALIEREGGARSDLFIADSEAQGVRILQLSAEAQDFVDAPLPFFPLAIPAPGFPDRVAAAADGRVVFALSPATAQLHVLDAAETVFGVAAAHATTFFSRGTIALSEVLAEDNVPVDVAVVPLAAAGPSGEPLDVVAIAFDVLGGPTGVIAALAIHRDTLEIRGVDTATVGAGPRAIAVRPNGLLVASAGSSEVTEIAFEASPTASAIFAAQRALPAGGPTHDVVDAGLSGAVAFRTDIPAAIVFEIEGGRLVRSRRLIASPFTPVSDASHPDRLGRIDLRPSPVASAAFGRTAVFAPVVPSAQAGLQADVVYVAHADAYVSFLVGPPLSLSGARDDGIVTRVERLRADGFETAECTEVDPLACGSARAPPSCSSILGDAFDGTPQVVRAAFLGDVATGTTALLRRRTLTSSTATVAFTLHDDDAEDTFADRGIRAGDRVLIQLDQQGRLVSDTATIRRVDTATLAIDLALSSPLARVSFPARVLAFNVSPGTAEYVVTVRRGASVRLVERVPTSTAAKSPARVSLPIALTLVSPEGGLEACDVRPRAEPACFADVDCASGACKGASATCAGVCAPMCAAGDPGCAAVPLDRVCSGVDVFIEPVPVAILPSIEGFEPRVPEDTIFIPVRERWMTTYPGTRGLSEVGFDAESEFVANAIR